MVPLFSQQTVLFVIIGIATGSLIALVALSIVLVQRSSGVINFSASAFGGAGACFFYSLRDNQGWPTPVAFVVAMLIGAVLGMLTHWAIRFMRRASTVAKLIATLALMSAAEGVLVIIYGDNVTAPAGILPTNLIYFTSKIQVNLEDIIIIAITLVLALVLWFVYSKTMFGLATSAVSENRRVAAASGWSPGRIELINFAVAGMLSTFAAILIAPIVTLQAETLALLIIPALAAALLGRFSSFPLAIAGAIFIGIGESLLQFYQTDISNGLKVSAISLAGLPDVFPLVVIVAILIWRGSARLRRGETQYKLQLAGDGRLNWPLLALGIAVGLVLVFTLNANWVDAVILTIVGAILILSVVVVTGYAGQLSLAQYSLAGFGCWIAARLVSTAHWPFLWALIIAALGTIPLGLIVAVPALRSRGVNLGVATLAMASVIESLVFGNSSLTGGYYGLSVGPPTIFGLNIDPIVFPDRYAVFCLIVLVLVGLVVANVRRGRSGHRLLAVRSNERAAAALGVGVYRAKMYAFALAAGIAALGGVLYGFQTSNITFNNFDTLTSIQLVLDGVIGGIGWPSGSIVGATLQPDALGAQVWQTIFPTVTNLGSWLMVVSGVLVIITLRTAPDGIAAMHQEKLRGIREKLRRNIGEKLHLGRAAGVSAARSYGPAAPRREPASLEIRNLSVSFGGVKAVSNVSFSVSPGEIVGLMGPNGAGKTTIIDVITGFTPPGSGIVLLGGQPIERLTAEQRARRGIGRSWQAVELFEDMSLHDNLVVAEDSQSGRYYLTDLVVPGRPRLSEQTAEIVEHFDLTSRLLLRPPAMPAGTARLAGIARALAANPAVLLLDEPAAGLDAQESEWLGATIRSFVAQHGVGVLLVEHDVEMLAKTCDRIVALDFGQVVAQGTPTEVMESAEVLVSYLGSSEHESTETGHVDGMADSPVTMKASDPA
jgi:sulfate-transporting ATPase